MSTKTDEEAKASSCTTDIDSLDTRIEGSEHLSRLYQECFTAPTTLVVLRYLKTLTPEERDAFFASFDRLLAGYFKVARTVGY
jgi:ABC-type transporter MlaC component